MEKHLNAEATQNVWGQLMPSTDDSLLATPRKGKRERPTKAQLGQSLSLQTHSGQRDRRGRPHSCRFPSLAAWLQAGHLPLPRPKNESKNPACKSKGQARKGERGQGSGALDRYRGGRRNLQFYHHGKHLASSTQFQSLLLITTSCGAQVSPLSSCQANTTRQKRHEGQYLQPSLQAWQRSAPQLLTQAHSTFPYANPGSDSHWTAARLWKHI